ncbi:MULTISPECIES: hypothetical protein [unclassified Paenibacillus]|uniref:hypothetical protein n=1 Tax=unclassified Paenibacillus TaxID=185978 RepID=UPI0009548203|nr:MULTISPECIES: hypothetical protein [unclassified Paenibacillus]ASS65881.1 hypothetical protein CIC07_06800 [Paenibacillus sp. RUD330]SIQ20299.1 hypothetical protein SAMN05880555_1002 [Paenibacillus sp. RU4X]SIQ41977.1 hypothetical protein SAMN05880570_1001 [Paenibacillus sp. RU4T]
MSKGKGGSSKAAKKKAPASDRRQVNMKLVLSDTCAVCKTPCGRGMRYLDRMRQPGALGKGVPCVLTRTYG